MPTSPDASGRITVDGRALELERLPATRPGLPTLVFLHEGIGSVSLWRDFPAVVAAATGCETIVYSRFGYGQSDVLDAPRAKDYMHHEALVVLPALLARLGVRHPLVLGHSDGASIALMFAARHPETHAVIVEAPHVFVEAEALAGIRAAKVAWETTDLRDRLGRHHADAEKTFFGWNDTWLDPAFADWNIEAFLPDVTCPVLAIQGYDDEYGTMAQLDAVSRQVRGPCETLRLDRCRHSPHRDRPDEVRDAIVRFLASHPLSVRDVP